MDADKKRLIEFKSFPGDLKTFSVTRTAAQNINGGFNSVFHRYSLKFMTDYAVFSHLFDITALHGEISFYTINVINREVIYG